jgi:hypothetical protein
LSFVRVLREMLYVPKYVSVKSRFWLMLLASTTPERMA